MPYTFFDNAIKRWEPEGSGSFFTASSTLIDVLRFEIWQPEEYLARCDTRLLKKYLRKIHVYGYSVGATIEVCADPTKRITHEQLSAELAKHPHIPSKQEAKELRRLGAQGKTNQFNRLKRRWTNVVSKASKM